MTSHKTIWTFAITSVALFMVTLDNLVVTTALPVDPRGPRRDLAEPRVDRQRLHADVRGAAADRRRARRPLRPPAHVRVGLGIFTVALRRRRARPRRRARSGARGPGPRRRDRDAADADDPLGCGPGRAARRSRSARGAVSAASPSRSARSSAARSSSGISWHWIFWLNVPIGLVLAPLALLAPGRDARAGERLDLPGVGLASVGLLRDRLGPRPRQRRRLGFAARSSARLLAGAVAARAASSLWELRAPAPMLPMRFFRNRAFALTNVASL